MPSHASTTHALWKGAISFGLVHIPVALHSATRETGIDFDWLDKRTMDPVGYKRINKKTGKEIDKDNIVKGVATGNGEYAVLSDEEIKAAYPQSTQSIDIEAFVPNTQLPFLYLDRPYYLEPIGKGEKVYALLRETLLSTGRLGLARVVIANKQHLAALVPCGAALVLNLLRWGESIRDIEALHLPPSGAKAAGLTARELKMAEQLVDELTVDWNSDQFHDTFTAEVMALVEKKVKAGETEDVAQPIKLEETAAANNVVDLTELLQRSLRGGNHLLTAATAKKSKGTAKPVAKQANGPRRKVG